MVSSIVLIPEISAIWIAMLMKNELTILEIMGI